jgi:hypothetical protein
MDAAAMYVTYRPRLVRARSYGLQREEVREHCGVRSWQDLSPSSSRKDPPMTARHSPLTAAEVIAKGGWHPRYARVIALASDDGYGFALADGNGDGSELEAEAWTWRDGAWHRSAASGAGQLDGVGPISTGRQIGENAWFAYGSAPAGTLSRSRSTANST